MSDVKTAENPLEGGENSDQSLSDSWTVLDSSHFKEDGDLSDAESVEVLASEELPVDDILQEDKFDELVPSGLLTAPSPISVDDTAAATTVAGAVEAPAASAASPDTAAAAAEDWEDVNQEDNACTASQKAKRKRSERRKRFLRGYWNDGTVKAFRESLGRFLFEISLYSFAIDILFLTVFGLSSLSCLYDQSSYSLIKDTKSYQQYEMDPLSLQLSHVLAEWKKQPQEDHSLDRHLLKTLLLYFGGSTELSANLQALTERVQKHNKAIRQFGNEEDVKIVQHHRMVVSGHLAHSVACILGKQDNDRALPAELFTSVRNRSDENNAFAPEPGFWLHDWHLPQYFKANNTYYRIDTKPVLPPMRNLFLHLGSAKWNHYFWKLYHQDENESINNEKEGKETITNEDEDDTDDGGKEKRIWENELDGEETERSPLDINSGGDFIPVEESSGNVNLPDNPEERVGILYPLFVNNLDSDDEVEVDDFDEKIENFGSYLNVLDGDRYYGSDVNYHGGFDCLDGGCEQSQERSDEIVEEVEMPKKSTLSELFEENALDEQQARELIRRSKLSALFDDHAVEEQQEEKMLAGMLDEFASSEPQKGKKTKTKVGKRRRKYHQSDLENLKGKTKQKKKNKRKSDFEDNNFDGKKKSKVKDGKKKAKPEASILRNLQLEEKFLREQYADWNSRMAQGREKLRSLSEKGSDQIWVFERARARRDLREETFSE